MSEPIKGRRISYEQADNLAAILPGDFWFDPKDGWYAACPTPKDRDGFITCLAYLKNHRVTEHEDGTITVHPSILTKGNGREYHGWLERGLWREA